MNETPKPKPPVTKQAAKQQTEDPKKPFVRTPHLTSRPFQTHPGLTALQKQMETTSPRRKKGNDK